MQRRGFLQSILAAAAAVAAAPPATVSASTAAFAKEISEAVRMVYGLLRECRIVQVTRRGENILNVTYERDGKRRHDGPLFDWIEANAHPRSMVVSSCVDEIDARHLGDPFGFKSMTPTVQVEVEWVVADIEDCPIFGYHEVTS